MHVCIEIHSGSQPIGNIYLLLGKISENFLPMLNIRKICNPSQQYSSKECCSCFRNINKYKQMLYSLLCYIQMDCANIYVVYVNMLFVNVAVQIRDNNTIRQ